MHQLEAQLATLLNCDSALTFNSGYQLNISMIPTIVGKGDVVFADKFIHASLIDGITLSGAKLYRFKHNDMAHLEQRLIMHRSQFKHALIITESVFSMEGDLAPISEIAALKTQFNALLYVDESHAMGVFGPMGRGRVADILPVNQCDFIIGTFGKAYGSSGAFIGTNHAWRETIINKCRGFIYSTAAALPLYGANSTALKVAGAMEEERKKLHLNAEHFRAALKEKGMECRGASPIIPVLVGDNQRCLDLQKKCEDAGFYVASVRPPTVPQGEARLRVVLTTQHTDKQIQGLIDCL
jgi:8-amino-7-oxononanoate synthase